MTPIVLSLLVGLTGSPVRANDHVSLTTVQYDDDCGPHCRERRRHEQAEREREHRRWEDEHRRQQEHRHWEDEHRPPPNAR